jgi:hypothetical protein
VAKWALGVPARLALLVTEKARLAAGLFHLAPDRGLLPLPHIDEVTGNCGRRRHCRRHEMRAALVTLTPFKIAI